MVYAPTLIVAAFTISTVFAAPAPKLQRDSTRDVPSPHPHIHHAEAAPVEARDLSVDSTTLELDARDPFSFGRIFKKVGGIAKRVGGVALKAAPLLIRDEDGSLAELDLREFDLDTVVERDLDLSSEELDARDPFSFKNAFRKVSGATKKVGGVAVKTAPLILRDEDGSLVNVEMRDLFESELEAREPEPEPKFNFGKLGRVALGAAKLLIRDEEGSIYYVREVEPDAGSELEAREPKFRIGRILKKVGGVAGKAVGAVNRISGTAAALGLRELDVEEELMAAREFTYEDLEELDARGLFDAEELEELAARDPKFNLGGFLKKAKTTATKVLRTADDVSKKAHSFGLREFLEEPSIDELD